MSVIPFVDALTPVINKVLSFIPDPEQRLKAQMDLLNSLHQWDSEQSKINEVEAAHRSLFVAGWRPFIGWVCGLSLAYQYVIIPFATWICAFFAVNIPGFPTLDDNLWQLLTGMLGLGGLRTFEKIKGISK